MSRPPSSHTCGLCGVRQLVDVTGHALSEHARLPLLECCHCGYLFRTTDEFEAHLSKVHQRDDGSCAACDLSFALHSRDNHLRKSHAALQPLKCDLCDHCCAGTDSLDHHIAAEHTREWRTCVRCCFERSTACAPAAVQGVAHIETSFGVKLPSIQVDVGEPQAPILDTGLRAELRDDCAQTSLEYQSYMPRHDMNDGTEPRHSRSYALVTGTNPDSQDASVRFYIPPTLFFRTERGLVEHLDAVHGQQGYNCDICGFVSESQNATRWHRSSSHPTALPWRCEFCNLRFRLSENLKDHIIESHPDNHKQQHKRLVRLVEGAAAPPVNLKLYVCAKCSRTFGTPDSAARHHELVHAPIACHICGAEFGDRTWLSYHEGQCEVKFRIGCISHFPEYMALS
jgi:DNA-directed RNA polymerase subunit RPC12/RpoP